MAKSGWMKMHRRFLDWEWFGCAEMVQLFTWLLLSASDRDVHYRGVALRRGQVLVSRRKLSQQLHMSERTFRTCISRLQTTGEITTQTTHLYTIVTICNYDVYQAPSDSKRPTTDPLPTHQTTHQTTHFQGGVTNGMSSGYKGEKEASDPLNDTPSEPKATHIIKNKEYIVVVADARTREEAIGRLRQELSASTLKVEAAMRTTRIYDRGTLMQLVEEVFAEWTATDERIAGVNWAHLLNQLRIKAEAQRREAAKLASLPKPKQDLKDWKKDFAAGMLRTARQRLAEDELSGAQKN